MESLTPLQEAAVFVSSVWQGEFYVDWPTGVLIFSIILYMVLGVLTALWAAMIYCHMRSGRRSTKSTPLLYLFIISCIGCIARMVWAAVSIALDYESSYWAHEIPKRIAQISIAWYGF
jgi:hypothetical protein